MSGLVIGAAAGGTAIAGLYFFLSSPWSWLTRTLFVAGSGLAGILWTTLWSRAMDNGKLSGPAFWVMVNASFGLGVAVPLISSLYLTPLGALLASVGAGVSLPALMLLLDKLL